MNGESVWGEKDRDGRFYFQEMIREAMVRGGDETVSYKYTLGGSGSDAVARLSKLRYFKPWDWIIGVDCTEEEFTSVCASILKLERRSNIFFVIAAGVTLFLVVLVSRFSGGKITHPILHAVDGLFRGAHQTFLTSKQVAESSQSVARGAAEQAASIEETSSSLEEMNVLAEKMRRYVELLSGIVSGGQQQPASPAISAPVGGKRGEIEACRASNRPLP